MLVQIGCSKTETEIEIKTKTEKEEWIKQANLSANETVEELYSQALQEDTLIVYTVSTRVTKVKESFEKEYPGLSVEVRDLRSPDLVEAVWSNYNNGGHDCDVVICNDNSGSFCERLVRTGAVVPYLPEDIKEHMREECVGDTVTFLNEAELLFYNSDIYDKCPISNIWELTEEKYQGKLYVPNPLRSFSTYALFGSILDQSDLLEEAYISLYGHQPKLGAQNTVAELFLRELSKNVVYTNSSDEVYEALGTPGGKAEFGIMVSSKLRMQDYGYTFEPVYDIEPFCGCRTSFAIMMASGSQNISIAKLFIRYLLGESDGTGEGYKPFITKGTWSAREDVSDVNTIQMDDVKMLIPEQQRLCEQREKFEQVFETIIKR